MAKYKVTDIDWDAHNEDVMSMLPKNCEVFCDDEDFIADALSDEWGFCVNSIGNVELIEE